MCADSPTDAALVAQNAELRAQLASMLGLAGYPQILLRLGYGEETPPSPRRAVRELLVMHKTAHH